MKLTEYAKDCLTRYPMTLGEALRYASPSPFNRNMIRALSLLPWNNTQEDEKRLVAAIVVERCKGRLVYEGPVRRWVVAEGRA